MSACGTELNLSQLLFADDTALVVDSEERLKQLVDEFERVCKRRKLRVNESKSKVMKYKRVVCGRRIEVTLRSRVF